ncbi:MAG: hypothetical protein QOK36_4321 [Gaiellales bacterium]|jgi:serine/threonine protein kinase|nr:hypothetical protein [Gaiellales bacterium]
MSGTASARIGTEVAGYRIEGLIGQGGMGVVYLAEHVRLGRKVALKLLAPVLSDDEDFRDRFTGESRRAAQLEHPNIVPIYDAGEAEGTLYIAMRYVEGCDLKTLIQREGQISIGRTLFMLEQIASALDAAHDHDLIHRDVKPANILIAEPSEAVYLTDFGIAKNTASPALTRTGMFIGALDYAAPEQIEGLPVDARTDVYGLGCVLYECLTGKPPFERDTELAVIHAHLVTPPPLLTSARPDLPKTLNRVLANAMAKSKDDRYASCEELIDEARGTVLKRTTSSGRVPAIEPSNDAASVSEDMALATTSEDASEPPSTTGMATPGAEQRGTSEEPRQAPARGVPAGPSGASRKIAAWPPWWRALALVVVAAAISGIVVYLIAGGGKKAPTATPAASTVTSTTTTPQVAPANATGLAQVVQKDVWTQCTQSTTPRQGSVQSAVCLPPANATSFFPDRLDVAIYANAGAQKAAFDALRSSDPKSAALVQGTGKCNNVAWNGYGPWFHANGDLGGHRFCYFDAEHHAVIVWTHERLGTPSHLDFIGIARSNQRGDNRLFPWWNFWHNHLGKCSAPNCVAHVPTGTGSGTGTVTTGTGSGTGTGATTTSTGGAVATGLAGVVQRDVWSQCNPSAAPRPGAAASAVCLPAANASRFFPDRLDISIYNNGRALKSAFNALRASDPKSAALIHGRGACNNVTWNGYGPWHHANGDLGGQRYCYFDAKHQAVIVWTHERLGTPSHVDFVGVARSSQRGDNQLFPWWNFWHNHLGKCSAPNCIAHVT